MRSHAEHGNEEEKVLNPRVSPGPFLQGSPAASGGVLRGLNPTYKKSRFSFRH